MYITMFFSQTYKNYKINLTSKLVDSKINQSGDCTESTFTYEDGTIISFIQKADNITISSNSIVVNPNSTIDLK